MLGPKLFDIYINDICKTSQILRFAFFADDTNIVAVGDNLAHLLQSVTSELIYVYQHVVPAK